MAYYDRKVVALATQGQGRPAHGARSRKDEGWLAHLPAIWGPTVVRYGVSKPGRVAKGHGWTAWIVTDPQDVHYDWTPWLECGRCWRSTLWALLEALSQNPG